jgi:hypothetical protein
MKRKRIRPYKKEIEQKKTGARPWYILHTHPHYNFAIWYSIVFNVWLWGYVSISLIWHWWNGGDMAKVWQAFLFVFTGGLLGEG